MIGFVKDFILMLQFFTRLPINLSLPCERENFRRGIIFLPIVGLIIGSFQWAAYYILIKSVPANITAIVVLLIGILVTGALHLDGLGDTCDGFFSFKGKEKIIEIMKDSRIGTYSCVAVIIDLMLKVAATMNLIESGNAIVIIAAPVMAKTVFAILFYIGKQAKVQGTGNFFIKNIGILELVSALLIGYVLTGILLGWFKALIILVICSGLTYLFNRFCESKIGGLTGDSLGANNEIIEIFTLILALSVII